MKLGDHLLGLGAMAFGGLIISLTHGFPSLEGGYPGPALFPRLLGGLFLFFGFVLFLQGIRTQGFSLFAQQGGIYRPGLANYLSVVGAVIAYMAIINSLGFVLSAFLILTFLMKKMGVSLVKSAMIAIAVGISINLLFAKFLLVPLPGGILGW